MVKLRRNVRNKFRTVVVAHVLKLHIKGYMGHFIMDCTDQIPAPKSQAVEAGKSLDGFRYFFALPGLGQPVDHIQGVIEKMGIDLCLEGAKFRDSQFGGCFFS